jgi:uncharacterized protein YgiM (DUF1202 family)
MWLIVYSCKFFNLQRGDKMKKLSIVVVFILLHFVSTNLCCAETDLVTTKFPVKLMSKPTFKSTTVALLDSGVQLTVFRYDNQWIYVGYQNKIGYVAVAWVDGAKVAPDYRAAIAEKLTLKTADKFVTTKSTTGLMRRPSFTGSPLMKIPAGEDLALSGKTGRWFMVTFGDEEGYVEERFVSSPQLTELGIDIAISSILADLEFIPESAVKMRQDKYLALLGLDPDNKEFRKAFDKYKAAYEAQLAKERELAAKQTPKQTPKLTPKPKRYNNGRIHIGMTADEVRAAWGKPENVNKTIYATEIQEQWVYNYDYVYFRNGLCTSIQTSR